MDKELKELTKQILRKRQELFDKLAELERKDLIDRVTRLEEAAKKRIESGHNDTCELMLIEFSGEYMPVCTCGHDLLVKALK